VPYGGGAGDAEGTPPDWVAEWLSGHRQRAGPPGEGRAGGSPEGSPDGARVGDAPPGPAGAADPAAARRRAERRAERVASGASELEQRLTDLVRGGLAGADRAGYAAWEETAARMVDAQAPGLAARVRELGAIAASGPGWPARLLEECALTHLLGRAASRVSRLPEPLAATVRARVGFTLREAELFATADAVVRDRWLVLGARDTVDDRMTTRRVWLRGEASGRPALVLAFGPAGREPDLLLSAGTVVDAELAFHPGARPLRAALGAPLAPPDARTPPGGPPPPGCGAAEALASYGEALRDDPWLDAWPVVLSGVIPIPGEDGWQLADERGDAALPIDPRRSGRPELWRLPALSGGGPLTVFGECGHRGFLPLTAWSPETAEVVPL
ncbi:SWIM zinc finger family protein, partial [Streptomyces sp. URMC 123]|uniref:SWIM zinc finger family protein n=1 Tax=Streptomyces sp. URMC 123 TaxID=3423403 RepID=UPI003F1A6242